MACLRVPAASTLSGAIVCAMLATAGVTPAVAARSLAPVARTAPSYRVGVVAASQGPLVAVALRGDIYAVPADGSAPPRRLTAYGHNSSPALSPHGRLIAYLSVPQAALRAVGVPPSHNVWIVPMNGASDGSSGYKITPTSPDGRSLLINRWFQGAGVHGQSGFWLTNADGTGGRLLNPAPLQCCALVQSVWLTDSSGLAFVSLQVLNPASGNSSPSGPPIRAQLYSMGLNGTSHLLYTVTDPDQRKMEIAPAFGCVVCGA